MTLLFTEAEFFAVFAVYNATIWPALVIAYLLGGLAVYYAVQPLPGADHVISAVLAALWFWTGMAYHAWFFSAISPLAYPFAIVFIFEGILFVWYGIQRRELHFAGEGGRRYYLGLLLIVYAMLLHPMVGWWLQDDFLAAPSFGITPGSLVAFTFGLLLMAQLPLPRVLLAIPLLWAIIGGGEGWLFHMPQDWLLPLAGIAAAVLLWRQRKCAAP